MGLEFRRRGALLVPLVDRHPLRIHFQTTLERSVHFNQVNRQWFVSVLVPRDVMAYVQEIELQLRPFLHAKYPRCFLRSCLTESQTIPLKLKYTLDTFAPPCHGEDGAEMDWKTLDEGTSIHVDMECIGMHTKHGNPYLMWNLQGARIGV